MIKAIGCEGYANLKWPLYFIDQPETPVAYGHQRYDYERSSIGGGKPYNAPFRPRCRHLQRPLAFFSSEGHEAHELVSTRGFSTIPVSRHVNNLIGIST